MNVDSPSDSPNNICEVKSKYFTSKGGMDESLSDFQEKKTFIAPKNSQATKASTSKPKAKKTKKIKGQKDIRTALKGKKNELIAYSNEFEKVCKQSGIDVDPEQLQLAIALSKSLQSEDNGNNSQSRPLNSKERSGEIRTTLKEYGFVVPDTKITAPKSRKIKKYRKDYKLIQTTEEEKQKIITDKFSQVLLNNLDNTKSTNHSESINNTSHLFNIVTNILYEHLKDNTIFYCDKLLELSPNSIGSLLRDWSEIPGRPKSPTTELEKTEFDKIYCSQEELDLILSGTLETAQDIARNKYNLLPQAEVNTIKVDIDKCSEIKPSKMDTESIEILDLDNEDLSKKETEIKLTKAISKPIDLTQIEDTNLFTVTQNIRSCSPDIFGDDEASEIIETISQDLTPKKAKVCNEVLVLTEHFITNSQKVTSKPNSQLSQGTDSTKRRSNDFMEMTECVVGSSQPIRENVIVEENIDLTQSPEKEDEVTLVQINNIEKETDVVNMDLTQSSESSNDLPEVDIGGKESLDETIILNEDTYTNLNNKTKPSEINSSNNTIFNAKSGDIKGTSLPPIRNLSPTDNRLSIDMENEIDRQKHGELEEIPFDHDTKNTDQVDSTSIHHEYSKETILSPINARKTIPRFSTKSKTESFFEEFVHEHSDEHDAEVLCLDESSNSIQIETAEKENEDIDLTQDTHSSEEIENVVNADSPKLLFNSNLGKVGNVSIDYDEIFDELVQSQATTTLQSKNASSISNITSDNKKPSKSNNTNSYSETEKPSKSDLVSNSSQNSEVFDISDKELDYSLHQSRLDVDIPRENFDFGGISVVDNLPDLPSFRPSTDNIRKRSLNRSLSDSYLPPVNVKRSENLNDNKNLKSSENFNDNQIDSSSKSCNTVVSTPFKCNGVIAKTPKNGEYILKTEGVTPIMDYDAMSTPDVNAELDKYGLKPFKRKRAIQLLTHLYNQTHPIVASCSQDSSPFKRQKLNTSPVKRISPKKITTMFKTVKSPKGKVTNKDQNELEIVDKENDNLYEITTFVPVIKNIECEVEDLVFQKREKAKVHSCRVPLHIAFHNYVSARLRLREAILRYEPVNIDVIHKGLAADGHRFDPKDLLKFMDKKCITVKTADNNKNKKHY